MKKYKLLDLFCGAGGAAAGYIQAGFDVTGVDVLPQPDYPGRFIQADVMDFDIDIKKFDVIHASPPCQKYSHSTAQYRNKGVEYPDLVEPVRAKLIKTGLPYVIENVITAPLQKDLVLVGYPFGLKVIRKRIFEFGGGFWMMQPLFPYPKGQVKSGDFVSVYGSGSYIDKKGAVYPKFKKDSVLETWQYAMNCSHIKTCKGLSESILPAYTHYIGVSISNYLAKLNKNARGKAKGTHKITQ